MTPPPDASLSSVSPLSPVPARRPRASRFAVAAADLAALRAERDSYRAQAVAFVEALVELGHDDVVDRVLDAQG